MSGLSTFETQSWLERGHSFSFISTPNKEQVASDGYCSARVIPAFRPFLDHTWTEDMTICSIRALRYYLILIRDLR